MPAPARGPPRNSYAVPLARAPHRTRASVSRNPYLRESDQVYGVGLFAFLCTSFFARASRGGAPPLYPAFVAPPRLLGQAFSGAPPPRAQALSAADSVQAAG